MKLILLFLCAAAQTDQLDEEPFTIGAVNTLTAEARLDNGNGREGDDNFGVFINRLNLSANGANVTLGARLDTVMLANTPTTAFDENDLRLERVSAEFRFGDATLIAGDNYRQLGRGLLLSLRKVDEVGLDLALRGAELRWSPEGHAFAAFAGVVNTANIDTVSVRTVKDTGDILAGGNYELSAIDGLNAGIFGLYSQPSERLLPSDLDYTISGGLNLELPEIIEGISLYTEVVLQDRHLAGGSELGNGIYVTADWIIGDLTILVEGLRLQDMEQRGSRNTALGSRFDYNQPPTLERLDQEVSASYNVTGGRVRTELAFLEGDLITHANGMVRVNDPGEPAEVLQAHGYGGAELRFDERASKIAASGGYRDEQSGGAQIKTMIHFEVDIVKALARDWALHLLSGNEFRTLEDRRYERGSTFLGVEWAGHGSLTFELGYDSIDPSPEVRSLFFAGILQVDISEAVRIRTNAGTQRGGLKCVAGVCREFPAFAGVRSEIVIRL